jgi:FAD/FMN-containing dehydrogenase
LDETTLNQVVAWNSICYSQKQGLRQFSDAGGVERVSFFTGSGEAIQNGGYNTKADFGIDLGAALFGTRNNFGVPFEFVLNVEKKEEDKVYEVEEVNTINNIS